MTFALYLLFLTSYFLHLPSRLAFLGAIRFDLILVAIITVLLAFQKDEREREQFSDTSKILIFLCIYIIITIPLVQWPGSVIKAGIPNFIKAIVFFFFTASIIRNENQFKWFMFVFLACQTFRVLEPLYLHFTEGYWGSATHMGNWEMMDRLAGAPHDVINPNGLAFVITSIIPFYYFLGFSTSLKTKIVCLSIIPLFVYALVLTASRSGFLALLVIIASIFVKIKRKLLFASFILIAAIVVLSNLTAIQRDRYMSITTKDVRGAETAQSRLDGVINNFRVAMHKPLVGHGIGTSLEANANLLGSALPAHNLYAELMQELGLIGLIIFLLFIRNIIRNFREALKRLKEMNIKDKYLFNTTKAMQIWLWMNILFSFASYGLSSYEWYLFGGLSIVVKGLSEKQTDSDE